MAAPPKLVLFVEGQGDVQAAPLLVRRILNDLPEPIENRLVVDDEKPLVVRGVSGLLSLDKKSRELSFSELQRFIRISIRTRKPLGGILILLDGDSDQVAGLQFCPVFFGQVLAEAARLEGAGAAFSLAVVFLMKEYEAIFLSNPESFNFKQHHETIPDNPELKRGVKEWLNKNLAEGYKETSDQRAFTELVDFSIVRQRMKSFNRLERAVKELVIAVSVGQHILSPTNKS